MSELRKLAEAAKGWSNITEIRPATEDDPCIMGALDDGEFYPVVTIDCEDYYVDSLPLAKFYAAATPKRVLGLLDEIERLNAEAVAADIRIANDSAVIAGLTAERDALRVDLIRLTEAAAALVSNEDHAISAGIKRDYQDGSQTWECWQGLRAAMKGEQP